MQIVRWIVILAGLFFLMLGMLFMWGTPTIPTFWLNLYLIGATLTAYSIPTLWIGITRTYRALVGGALSLLVSFGGMGIYLLRLGIIQVGQFCLYIAILSLWFFFLGYRKPKRKAEHLPTTTQWLLAFALTISLLEGLYLVVPLPGHFPWLLTPEISVLYGWVLIGGAFFFGWSLVQPIWENGYPVLYALIAYDLLLIGPLLSLLKAPSEVAVIPLFLWFAIVAVAGSGIWTLLELILRFFTVRKR